MKRFFSNLKVPKIPGNTSNDGQKTNVQTPASATLHQPMLKPEFKLPPMPHPCPHEHLALLVTSEGLLIRAHGPGLNPTTHAKLTWGKHVKVEEVREKDESKDLDWEKSVVVYGLIGLMELFDASYLLVISGRGEVGHVLAETQPVFNVKGVTAIPLTEDRAQIVLNTLTAKQASAGRPSLMPGLSVDSVLRARRGTTDTFDTVDEEDETTNLVEPSPTQAETVPRVKFADQDQVKLMTPVLQTRFEHADEAEDHTESTGSETSTLSDASDKTNTVAKTLAKRLSFWSRLSQRTPTAAETAGDDKKQVETISEGERLLDERNHGEEAQLNESPLQSPMGETEDKAPQETLESIIEQTAPTPASQAAQHSELENKIVREVIREYTSKGGMYFAYTFDVTRSLQHKQRELQKSKRQDSLFNSLTADGPSSPKSLKSTPAQRADLEAVDILAEPHPTLPLWRRVDKQFWWNEALMKPFIEAGLHSYILPVMQGFFQIASFHIPREPEETEDGDAAVVDYLIISRRSRDRAGLRYQRRGIDDDAHVANFVETEAIMRVDREGVANIFSYVQIRGSIPLYWAQPGLSLKPAPVVSSDVTHDQQLKTMRRHFERTVPEYGPNTIVNLAEQHGKEGQVTCAYRDFAVELDWADVQYNDYDFHAETKGMKYENIANLIEKMERTFEHQGYFWVSNERLMSEQKGVFRVNCIDCLDRTNVVQSAFARHALNRELGAVALLTPMEQKRTEVDVVFNDLWANNGDAISRAYAGTSALKGDFTRTGKRDLAGMLNDGINSISRMYTSTFGDWFSQAVIDFSLGNRTTTVFTEFLLKLQSTDPRDLIRVTKIRAEAIATAVARVLPEGERLLHGWTLFAPDELNTKLVHKFEEKILLLSATALYIVTYEYNLEKVKVATRVPLHDITQITKGAYILSPLEEASRDPLQNAGFVVNWTSERQETRVTSYAMRNSVDVPPSVPSSPVKESPSPGLPLSTTPSTEASGSSGPIPGMLRRASTFSTTASAGLSRRGSQALSKILTKTAPSDPGDATFAAFKALPVDPTRFRQGGVSSADELVGASTCADAVEIIVTAIREACVEAGNKRDDLVKDEDVVSAADAQKMTSVYSRMEYGVKRLLWLGTG